MLCQPRAHVSSSLSYPNYSYPPPPLSLTPLIPIFSLNSLSFYVPPLLLLCFPLNVYVSEEEREGS